MASSLSDGTQPTKRETPWRALFIGVVVNYASLSLQPENVEIQREVRFHSERQFLTRRQTPSRTDSISPAFFAWLIAHPSR
jgi:hypothetical protein